MFSCQNGLTWPRQTSNFEIPAVFVTAEILFGAWNCSLFKSAFQVVQFSISGQVIISATSFDLASRCSFFLVALSVFVASSPLASTKLYSDFQRCSIRILYIASFIVPSRYSVCIGIPVGSLFFPIFSSIFRRSHAYHLLSHLTLFSYRKR